jgi:hypothetical protein
MQLDIFADSRDVMLRNDVLDALIRRHATDSRQAWQRPAGEYPADETLPALATLIGTLEDDETARFADHGTLGAARRTLSEEVGPAAIRLLGQQAGREWLIPSPRALAQRAASLAFRADDSENHAAPLWLRAGDWDAAIQAVEQIESWRRIPAPLMWITHARYRLGGLESTWPLLAELAWLSPARFGTLLTELADTALNALRRKFDTQFEGTGQTADLVWFPAWVLIEKTALLPGIREAHPSLHTPPERATRLIVQILDLEKRGDQHELFERRRALRDLHAGLYDTYMKTR